MGLNKEEIYNYLFFCQRRFGGYTGSNLSDIAKISGYNRKTVKLNVEKWIKTDSRFKGLRYIGQHSVSITIEDIEILSTYPKSRKTMT